MVRILAGEPQRSCPNSRPRKVVGNHVFWGATEGARFRAELHQRLPRQKESLDGLGWPALCPATAATGGKRRPIARVRVSSACYTSTKETLGLKGWRWRQRGTGVPGASLLAALLPVWRSAVADLLLLFLLIPYGAALLPLAETGSSGCGMPRCMRSKVCCCRRSDRNARRRGPGWTASSRCPGGCGQLPAVPATGVASLAAARVEIRPIIPVSHVRIQAVSPRRSPETGFALFERPPPSI